MKVHGMWMDRSSLGPEHVLGTVRQSRVPELPSAPPVFSRFDVISFKPRPPGLEGSHSPSPAQTFSRRCLKGFTLLVSLIKYYLFYLLSLPSKVQGETYFKAVPIFKLFKREEQPAVLPSFHSVLSHLGSEGGQGSK